jgi:hypothetical protein
LARTPAPKMFVILLGKWRPAPDKHNEYTSPFALP